MNDDQWERYRDMARAKFGSATPMRLGIAVGESGADLPSPYSPDRPGHRQYNDGVQYGRLGAAHAAREAKGGGR